MHIVSNADIPDKNPKKSHGLKKSISFKNDNLGSLKYGKQMYQIENTDKMSRSNMNFEVDGSESWIDTSNLHYSRNTPVELEDILITPISDLHSPEYQLQSDELFQELLLLTGRTDKLLPLSFACEKLKLRLTEHEVRTFVSKVYKHNKPNINQDENEFTTRNQNLIRNGAKLALLLSFV